MNEKKILSYNKDGGHVVLEIKAGYATLGSYSALYGINGVPVQLGDGKLADDVPDIYILPVPVSQIKDCAVVIAGTYVSSPEKKQIHVEYVFLQDGQLLKGDNPVVIESDKEAISTTHTIRFKAE